MAQPQLATQSIVEVLAPRLDIKAQIAKTIDIEEIFRACFITTDRASECFRWLDELRILITFEIYCDKRHLHYFQRFLEDQEILRNSKRQHSSSLFILCVQEEFLGCQVKKKVKLGK